MSYLIGLAFVAILGALASALYFMLKGGHSGAKTNHMARALAFRVGFSILLFLCVLLAWKLGYIRPTGLPVGP
ncbi:MAG: twin transmembrane helix small protein [Betaproteobacteria bacterium]